MARSVMNNFIFDGRVLAEDFYMYEHLDESTCGRPKGCNKPNPILIKLRE